MSVSHAMLDTSGNLLWGVDEHRPHYAASIIKVPLVVAVLRAVDRGELRLDQRASIAPVRSVANDSPIVIEADSVDAYVQARPGESFPLALLIERSITVSSNETSNGLFALVGFDAVNEVLAASGCVASIAQRYFYDSAAAEAGLTNTLTAIDAAHVLRIALYGDLLKPASASLLRALLLAQRDGVAIPAGLPDGVTVGNKTGSTSSVGHDVGFVETDDSRAYILAVMSTGASLEEPATFAAIRTVAGQAHTRRIRL